MLGPLLLRRMTPEEPIISHQRCRLFQPLPTADANKGAVWLLQHTMPGKSAELEKML